MGKKYGVKLVRGPITRLDPDPLACETEGELRELVRTLDPKLPRAVDLFCGAGGLTIGLEQAGYQVILGVDTDQEALETHRSLAPGLTADWDLGDPAVVRHVAGLVSDLGIELVAGGPPCQPFSKAGRSMLRQLVRDGRRHEHDARGDLWQAFLEVVRLSRPPAVLMENVPDMALDRDILILRTMVDELEALGYSVEERLVETWRYEVPQFRQRLILVALRDGIRFRWPKESAARVSVRQAISDLPPVEGGWRPWLGDGPGQSYGGPRSTFQEAMRRWVPADEADLVFDHITRPVREDDAQAFAHMDSSTRYSDLPDELKRYRDDIFDDKYKRLDWDDLGRTITAHIAKDGYWYIHPEQDRTLTIREAARLQTFPDHVRFAGSPTAAFRQIGNAVPPMIGKVLGAAIRAAMAENIKATISTSRLSRSLARWIVERYGNDAIETPWHGLSIAELLSDGAVDPAKRWLALLSQVLLDRVPAGTVQSLWPVICQRFATPRETMKRRQELEAVSFAARRERQVEKVLALAQRLMDAPAALSNQDSLEQLPGVSRSLASTVCRLVPSEDADPIEASAPLLRVAARFWGNSVDVENKRSNGRLAVARLVGVDYEDVEDAQTRRQAALASLGLRELADHICTPKNPACDACPLAGPCVTRSEMRTLAG